MNEAMVEELIHSIKQAGAIRRGQLKPSRTRKLRKISVRKLRRDLALTQIEFSQLIRVSKRTLQNWEQGRRTPQGPALALLTILRHNPRAAIRALQPK